MKNYKIYELTKSISMPYVLDYDVEYYPEVGNKLADFKQLLIALKADKNLIKTVTKFRDDLLCIIRKYYKGNIAQAQIQMNNIVKAICDADEKAVVPIRDSIVFEGVPKDMEIPFFRARLDADEDGFKAEDMGAIPFSKRTKADTARFSMPGIPCLYLGNTSYDCWLETGKPEDHRFNVSPIYLDETQRVFDLGVFCEIMYEETSDKIKNNKDLYELKKDLSDGLIKRLMLTMCSSFRVKEKNRIFKSEYMIPQLLMLSCQKQGMDGVLYFSCKVKSIEVAGVNVALFARYPNNRFGIKIEKPDICNHIKVGDAYNYSLFKQNKGMVSHSMAQLPIDCLKWTKRISLQNRPLEYREMFFYDYDRFLLKR